MKSFFKKLSPARIIALGFLSLILIGSFILVLPCSLKEGVTLKYTDALFTSTSAVCVTGLVVADIGDTFSVFGQFIVGLLIQIGGLGVTSVGALVILAMRKKISSKESILIREASNLSSGKGIALFIKSVFLTTVAFEIVGAILSFFVFIKDYPFKRAVGISIFHSVASFNNSGFDILGGFRSLTGYSDNVMLNIVTMGLIFFGGIGFLVIREVIEKKFKWKYFSMHTKVALSVSIALTVIGAVLLKLTENITWLGAFFSSVTARTAGFASFSFGDFSNAGLLVTIILMFIGASSGSTGGGVKVTTFFALLQGVKAAATNKSEKAFNYSMPSNAFRKAAIICIMGLTVVLTGTFLLVVMEPQLDFIDALFEIASAFGTAGLTTGITTSLGFGSKALLMVIMYIGRLGPMTIATLWYFSKGEKIGYVTGNISIG